MFQNTTGKLLPLDTYYIVVNMSEFCETTLAVHIIFLCYKILLNLEKTKVRQDVKFIES